MSSVGRVCQWKMAVSLRNSNENLIILNFLTLQSIQGFTLTYYKQSLDISMKPGHQFLLAIILFDFDKDLTFTGI